MVGDEDSRRRRRRLLTSVAAAAAAAEVVAALVALVALALHKGTGGRRHHLDSFAIVPPSATSAKTSVRIEAVVRIATVGCVGGVGTVLHGGWPIEGSGL